jgi:glycosyltransferase involved in cell wall biosynthesis
MRIVHAVRSDTIAGVERYVLDVASGLAQRGHQVAVVGTDVGRAGALVPPSVLLLPATTTAQVARRLAGLGPVDVAHAHMSAAEVAAVLSRPLHRGHVVATRHLAQPRGSGRSAVVTRAVARGLDAQVAISRFVAEATGEPMPVLYSGVADDDAPALGRPHRLLVLSRLEPEKAVDVAITGFAQSGLAAQGWRMVVAGEGSQRPHLELLAATTGVRDAVSFSGFVAEPHDLLRDCAALVAPTPREGLGLAVLEAMATATPVIAASSGAFPEVLGSAGVLVPPSDVAALARAMHDLAQAGDLARAAMGEALRQRQRTGFGREAHLDGLERLYRSVTGG